MAYNLRKKRLGSHGKIYAKLMIIEGFMFAVTLNSLWRIMNVKKINRVVYHLLINPKELLGVTSVLRMNIMVSM